MFVDILIVLCFSKAMERRKLFISFLENVLNRNIQHALLNMKKKQRSILGFNKRILFSKIPYVQKKRTQR